MANASTIFALSSAPGRAGVAVIRMSGPAVRPALAILCPPVPDDRRAVFRTLRDPRTAEALDRAVVLFFAAPKSETGEDVAEFQVHGSRAVVLAVLNALGTLDGCRMAEPGEFARRAFLNGKIDLVEVEGLADLVEAETEAQRRQALVQSSGVLSAVYEAWRARIIEAMALTEAAIDFSDEGDVATDATSRARTVVAACAAEIERHLADGHRGEIIRDGFRVALLGAPNAGKSSLLNALARRDAAIVSEEAGTTRDVIEVRLDLGGFPVVLSDTAGIRADAGQIEQEGMRRSLATAGVANLVLWLAEPGGQRLPPEEVSRETTGLALIVHTKADLGPPNSLAPGELVISTTTGEGLDGLVTRIADLAAQALADGAGPPLTQPRHRAALAACHDALTAFLDGDPGQTELRAENLRQAAHALGRITGRVDAEDVLDQIFSRFCIGK